MGCTGSVNRQSNNIKRQGVESIQDISKLREIVLTQSKINEDYRVINKVKEVNNKTYYLVNNTSNVEYSMKAIKKDSSISEKDSQFMVKLSSLKKLKHKNILATKDIYEDNVNVYLVTDIPKGKELFEKMKEYKNFSERMVGKIFSQLASIIYYMHSKKIIHGFLRPEFLTLITEANTEEQGTEQNMTLMLNEFGDMTNLCSSYYEELKLIEKIGKPYYTAPEILKKKNFDEKIDIFAAGIILFIMMSGKPPFSGSNSNDIRHAICEGEWEFDDSWNEASSPVKDLITKMLVPNPQKRISAKEVLSHEWVIFSKEDDSFAAVMANANNSNLVNFFIRDQLQQATMIYICNQLSNSSQIKELKKLFQEFDKNGDGVLSYDEFKIGYMALYGKGLQSMELDSILAKVDKDKSGKIEYEEFLLATVNSANLVNDQNLRAAFSKFDLDGSGKLSVVELTGIVGNDMDIVLELLKKVDRNSDGEVCFDEFKQLMGLFVEEKEKVKRRGSKRKSVSEQSVGMIETDAHELKKKPTKKKPRLSVSNKLDSRLKDIKSENQTK